MNYEENQIKIKIKLNIENLLFLLSFHLELVMRIL